jgi:hypothetical protein
MTDTEFCQKSAGQKKQAFFTELKLAGGKGLTPMSNSLGELMVSSLDGDPVRILGHDLFEPAGDRLLDLFFLKLDEVLRRIKTLISYGLLLGQRADSTCDGVIGLSLLHYETPCQRAFSHRRQKAIPIPPGFGADPVRQVFWLGFR